MDFIFRLKSRYVISWKRPPPYAAAAGRPPYRFGHAGRMTLPFRPASLHDLPMAGLGHYAHFRPPFNIFETAFPFPVSRYFCVGERGELGCVISATPISSAGYNALLRRCARLENRIFVRIW